MTIWPAWQHFEKEPKSSIEVGELADFAILSENPRTPVGPREAHRRGLSASAKYTEGALYSDH